MNLPWARIEQIVSNITENMAHENYEEWERAAFIGWQFHVNTPREAKYYRTCKQWLQDMGIRRPGEIYANELKKDKKAAIDNLRIALQAFDGKKEPSSS